VSDAEAQEMQDCIFCKIARHEIPCHIVYEDEDVLAFKDLKPVAPVHILVIPKKHISQITSVTDEDAGIMGKILSAIGKLAEEMAVAEDGFRVVVNQGEKAGQSTCISTCGREGRGTGRRAKKYLTAQFR
jgi:histidine triad (HIT) family protein